MARFGFERGRGCRGFFLTPPDSIGTAYDTNPPPLASLASLASLKGVLGSKPSQADLDLYVRSFARIAFEPEGDEKYPWILKWTKQVQVRVGGEVKNEHNNLLEQVVEDLSLITGLPFGVNNPPHEITGLAPGIYILINDHRNYKRVCGLALTVMRTDGSLDLQPMIVSTNIGGDSFIGCFYEDISQALGLYGDNALAKESMYRSAAENKLWRRPTWHDVIMLRTLYDRRIKAGMPEDQAMPIVRVIIAELLEELNAVAE